MSELSVKTRIQLLDENTGKPLADANIISDSEGIYYSNKKPTLKNIGKIPAGTTFNETPISDIFDGLLYEEVDYSVFGYTTSNGDITNASEDITIIKPLGTMVNKFTLNAIFSFGSKETRACTIEISRSDGSNVSETTIIQQTNNEPTKLIQFDIPQFDSNTDIRILGGPTIHYKFVSPVFVGWIRPDIINEKGELDKSTTEHYFKELIDHKFKTLETRYVDKSNQTAMIVPGINYDTRERLNPCILIPQSWGELKSITDMNGNNISNSYAHYVGIDINTHGSYIEHYIAYVSRQTFDDDENFIRAISYIVDNDEPYINMDNYEGNGTPLTVGYSVMYNTPIDERFYRKTYGDLLKMLYPYPGLQSYVEDINTTFRFEKGHWVPVSTKTHLVENVSELTNELGGWDDTAIVSTNGRIYKKRYNNVWEMWGEIKVNTDEQTVELKPIKKGE